jgi:hypothetical protein
MLAAGDRRVSGRVIGCGTGWQALDIGVEIAFMEKRDRPSPTGPVVGR